MVKGVNFGSLRDVGDPVEQAVFYDAAGADEIVFLDIAASKEGRRALSKSVQETAVAISIPLIVGGGIGSIKDIEELLAVGASKISIGTAALENPALIEEAAKIFGSEKVIVAIDAKKGPGSRGEDRGAGYAQGGRVGTGLDAVAWATRVCQLGAGEILLTSMDRDGTKDGYDNDLNRTVAKAVSVPIIASGGAGELQHFKDAFLLGKVDAILAASVFHYRVYSVREVKEYLIDAGIPMQL